MPPRDPYLSLAALARRLDTPHASARRLMLAGVFTPDHSVGRVSFFSASRLPEIRQVLREARKGKK